MNKYKSTVKIKFVNGMLKRIIGELLFLVLLIVFFLSSWSSWLPDWIGITLITLFALYVIWGIIEYPKAKSITNNFTIYLLDDALGFPDPKNGKMTQIPYQDLTISNVEKHHDEIVKIVIKTTFGQTIDLQYLEHMDELYRELTNVIT